MVPIPKEIPRRLVPRKRLAQLLGPPRGAGVVRDRDMHESTPIMGEQYEDEQQTACRGGHHKKSAAISWCTWFARNVRHVCDGDGRRRTIYFAIVWEIEKPSFSN